MASTGMSKVGKLQDADEESEGEDEGEEEEKEKEDKEKELEKKMALPVAKVLKKLGSPLKSLRKHKASQRSPESV